MFHIMIFLNNMISFLIRLFSIKLLERIIFFRSQTKKTIAKSKRTFTELYTTMKKNSMDRSNRLECIILHFLS
jgi:hypothetical protein